MLWSRHRRRFLHLALLIAALVAASLVLQDAFNATVSALAAYEEDRPVLGPLVFVVLAGLSVMLGPFTSAALIPFAVGVWGPLATLALLMTGWTLGNTAAYAIGYHLGYPVVRMFIPRWKLHRWTSYLRRKADLWLLFLIRLALPAEIGYVFGILKFHFLAYLLVVLAAEVPYALLLTFGGSAFLNGEWPVLLAFGFAAALLMAVAFRAVDHVRRR